MIYENQIQLYAPNALSLELTAMQHDIDDKIMTWFQSTDPSVAWTTTALKAAHAGDLWFYTGTTTSTLTENATYRYALNTQGTTDFYEWVECEASAEIFDKINGKTSIYYGDPSGTYSDAVSGDYLVDSSTGNTYKLEGTSWVLVTDYSTPINTVSETLTQNYYTNTEVAQMLTNAIAAEQAARQQDVSAKLDRVSSNGSIDWTGSVLIIRCGTGGDIYAVEVGGDGIEFKYNNDSVASINQQKLVISQTVVLDEMQVGVQLDPQTHQPTGGANWTWKFDSEDNSLYLKWIGV